MSMYRGYNIEIMTDDDPIDPILEYDGLGQMACFHNRYTLGHEHAWDELVDYCCKHPPFHNIRYSVHDNSWDYMSTGERQSLVNQTAIKLGCEILPLYIYEHSGITMSTGAFSCAWDSGCVGLIYATPEVMREWYCVKRITKQTRENARQGLEYQVEQYDDYLTGNVYGYSVNNGEVGSCYGFSGYDHEKSGLLDHARNDIDYHIETLRTAKQSKLKSLIRNHVPLSLRGDMLSGVAA